MFGKLENRGVVKAARGFSLVELLVVIGIISLLIGIALPAFSAAKTRAKIATTTAMINAISTGLEQFRADERMGGQYPPSMRIELQANPHLPNGTVQKMQYANGANLAVYALAGADLLGSAGIRDANSNDPWAGTALAGMAPWSDDLNAQTSLLGLYRFTPGTAQPAVARTSFVDVTKMKFSPKDEAASLKAGQPQFKIPTWNGALNSLAFLDSFDQPILYYRANVGQPNMCYAPGVKQGGMYDFSDNADITGARQQSFKVPGLDLGTGANHFPVQGGGNNGFSDTWELLDPAKRDKHKGEFAYTIWNPSVTARPMPHNPETYILLSAGPDGLFGTEDDIANFPTNK